METIENQKFQDLPQKRDTENLLEILEKFIERADTIMKHHKRSLDKNRYSKKPIHLKYEAIIERDGRKTNFELMIMLSPTDKKIIMVLTDVTERTENIKLKELSEYKSRLLASVSHELRTPLNGNIGTLELALRDELLPTFCKEEYIKPALDSSNYLLCIINDLLDFSQLNSRKLTLTFAPCNIRDLMEETVRLVRFASELKKIKLSTTIDDLVPKIVITDRNRLKQVLLNLLSNAVKFTYKGFVILSVKLLPTSDFDQKAIKFCVEDSGIGIKRENFGKLFQQFGKIKNDAAGFMNANGAGLGLMISNSLVQLLGADDRIMFDSEYGKGSKFWFTLSMRDEVNAGDFAESPNMLREIEGTKKNDI
jgi:signal transduction histidine kinase